MTLYYKKYIYILSKNISNWDYQNVAEFFHRVDLLWIEFRPRFEIKVERVGAFEHIIFENLARSRFKCGFENC